MSNTVYLVVHTDRDSTEATVSVYLDRAEAKKEYIGLWGNLYDISTSTLYVLDDGDLRQIHTGYEDDDKFVHATDDDGKWLEDEDGWVVSLTPEAQVEFDAIFEGA